MNRTPDGRQPFHLGQVEPLGCQDRPLVLRPAERVLADGAVRADDPMARDDERHRVVAEGRADRADRLRPADLRGDPAVRPDLAARDLEGLAARRRARSRCGRAGRGRCGPAGRRSSRRAMAVARRSGTRSTGCAGRPVRARWFASNVASSRRGLDGRDAQPVPGHDERPDRRVEAGVAIGQADVGQHVRGEAGGSRHAEAGQRRLQGSIVGGHAVISSRSCRWAASSAVRNNARPRWTCALTVPSGRSRAMASSG